jgi:uncharacterized membrane protein (UPF0127 family)
VTLAAAALLGACARETGAAPKPPGDTRLAERARVVVASPSGRRATVTAEVARTEADRARGLMWRERLGDDEGMLFVFPETADHTFWMRNTLIPLDMIFVDEHGLVTGVVARATPHSEEPRSAGRSRWVLEVNGGWAEAHGVRPGDRVSIEPAAAPSR